MIRRLLLSPYLIAEPWLRHSKWMVRRVAQVAVVGIAIVWLVLPGARRPERGAGDRPDELARRLWASSRLLEFLNGPAIAKPIVGPLCRVLVLRLSVHAQMRERASMDERNFSLRLSGPLDQGRLEEPADLAEPRAPVILPAATMAVRWISRWCSPRDRSARRDCSISSRSCSCWSAFAASRCSGTRRPPTDHRINSPVRARIDAAGVAAEASSDLGNMPRALTRQVERRGTRGGIKLLPHGRKYANDFLKLALPGRCDPGGCAKGERRWRSRPRRARILAGSDRDAARAASAGRLRHAQLRPAVAVA